MATNPIFPRPWREIARELAQETSRARIAELAEELNQAMAEQDAGTPNPSTQLSTQL